MLKILQARLQQYMNWELLDVQAGFKKGRRTRDQIANIHWIIEKARKFQKSIYFCFIEYNATAAKSLQSCLTLCNPIDTSPPGSPVPGILKVRTLEWVAISFSNAGKQKVKVKSFSRVWLRNPMDCSLPGSSAHGIFQARVLEWGAIAFSCWLH